MEKISVKHIREILGNHEEFVLINVLPRVDYQKEHIPGSVNIPLDDDEDFVQRVESIVPSKNYKIVLYSTGKGNKASKIAAKQLDEKGFSYVMNFEGGMQEWNEARKEVTHVR